MKNSLFTVAFLALLGSLPSSTIGALVFTKTVQGDAFCARPALKETKDCQTAIRGSAGPKPALYYAEANRVERELHSRVCGTALPVTATGVVREREGKRHMSLKDIAVTPQLFPGARHASHDSTESPDGLGATLISNQHGP